MSTKRRSDTDPRRNDPAPSASSFFVFILGSLAFITLILLLLFFLFMPPKLILSSPSPDRTMKIELWTQGSMGQTWADLIWLNQWKKVHVYEEQGSEVKWSEEVEVVWSEDSRRFFVASTQMVKHIRPNLTKNQYLYLADKSDNGNRLKEQYPAVVLTYDIPKKELRHNLHGTLRPFDRRDLKGIDWVKKLPD
jgi:transposase